MKYVNIICCLLAIGLGSCKSKKAVVKNVKSNKTTEVAVSDLVAEPCVDGENDLIWTQYVLREQSEVRAQIGDESILLRVDNNQLQQVFERRFKLNEVFMITLPFFVNGTTECMTFELHNSETMSYDMQAEMKIFTFKGIDVNNRLNTVRVDYSISTGLKVYGLFQQGSFLLSPVNIEGKKMYVSYNKNDSNKIKLDFE